MVRHAQSYHYHEAPPIVHYATLVLVVVALVFSVLAYTKVSAIEQEVIPEVIQVEDFLAKLTSHEQTSALVGIAPLNILEINQNNIANIQSQIGGIDAGFLGSYLVQYQNVVVVYDYDADAVLGVVDLAAAQQAQALGQDFSAKLFAHSQLAGVEGEQPQGGQIDQPSLEALQQQFPDVYANAKVGDFLLRFSDRLIIYDYANDQIVNSVALQ